MAGVPDSGRRELGSDRRAVRRAPIAFWQARSERRCSVETPRRASQLSNGLPVSPNAEATPAQASIKARRPGEKSERHVTVAADELGHRVRHDLRAEIQRPTEQRSEGVVDHELSVVAKIPQHGGEAGNVGDA